MRAMLYRGIESYYQATESFLIGVLKEHFDTDWWSKGIFAHLSPRQQMNVKLEMKRRIEAGQFANDGRKIDPLYFKRIVEGNWDTIFQDIFDEYNQGEVLAWFHTATNARNAVAHFDSVSSPEILEALTACENILRVFNPSVANSMVILKDELQFGKPLPESAELEWMLGDAYVDEGNYYASEGDFERAIRAYERFFPVNGDSGNIREEEVLRGLANAHEKLGNVSQAIEYYHRLAIFFVEFGDADGKVISAIYWKIGLLHEQAGQLYMAINEMQDCVDWETENNLPEASSHVAHLEEVHARAQRLPPEPEYVVYRQKIETLINQLGEAEEA